MPPSLILFSRPLLQTQTNSHFPFENEPAPSSPHPPPSRNPPFLFRSPSSKAISLSSCSPQFSSYIQHLLKGTLSLTSLLYIPSKKVMVLSPDFHLNSFLDGSHFLGPLPPLRLTKFYNSRRPHQNSPNTPFSLPTNTLSEPSVTNSP